MANRAEQQWREEEARKGMRIIEGSPAPLGPDERVQVFPFITVMEAAAGGCNLKTTFNLRNKHSPGAPILRLTLDCAPTVTRSGNFAVTVEVTYTGEVSGPDGRPHG
jgi:hypothetical protein